MVAMMGSQGAEKGWRKGPWTHEEDKLLIEYVTFHGEGRWSSVAKLTGLNRSGKSCRLRWVNYLRPGLKKGQLTPLEEGIICELHAVLGNKWSTIASYLPGRTDNEIKNYWRTHFMKRASEKSKQHNKKKEENRQRKKVQKQLKQEQQLQEQQPHDQEYYDIKSNNYNISSHDDDEGTKNSNETTECSESQDINREQQVMGFMHPTMLEQHQCYSLPSSMHQDQYISSSTWQDTHDDVLSWFSLWDFDEPLQGFIANKNVVPSNQGAPFGGDSMQNNHQDITSPFVGAYDNLCYGKYTTPLAS